MNIGRKVFSVGMSAALAASLLATIAVPAALASISQTSAGNVAQGYTSAGTATILFTENAINALTNTGTMTVTICDSAATGGPPATIPCSDGTQVTWAGTPVISAPDSLGASVSIAANVLTIKITGHDDSNVETIAVSGLTVHAASTAAPGQVQAVLGDSAAGAIYGAFVGGTTTAYGHLAQAYGIGNTSFAVALDTGSCPFSYGVSGDATSVTVGSESVTVTGVTANSPTIGQYTFANAGDPFTVNHLANEVVTQTVHACNSTVLASPANVVQGASFSTGGNRVVYPGENNSRADNLYVDEPATATPGGFLAMGTTLTFTITTPGVVFSYVPTASTNGHALAVSTALMSADRKTVTTTVTTASTSNGGEVQITGIYYDVAASVPGGTFVMVSSSLSGGLVVNPTSDSNAVVFRGVDASAPTPTVYIGENAQATGLITVTEQAAGFFQSGTGPNNVLEVCPVATDYLFTFAPWAKVTSGDLRLRDGSTASATNVVQGLQDGDCWYWTVWTASTAVSTIQIGNSTFSTGPLVNVTTDQVPGVVGVDIYSGDSSTIKAKIATVGFAVAAYRTQVAVVALSQPTIPAGAKSAAGDLQISETSTGQLKDHENICVEILPRSTTENPDVYMQNLNTGDLPMVTASGGIVATGVRFSSDPCTQNEQITSGVTPTGTHMLSFSFNIHQQSVGGTGKIVISNINVITAADAPNGPILFNVFGYGYNPTNVEFQATVSNAKIGVLAPVNIGALTGTGLYPNQGAWSTATKVAAANHYVTWRFTGGSQLAGKTVEIWMAKKNSAGGWSTFTKLTARTADASGTVYFWYRGTSTWVSVRAHFVGDTSVAESWSSARQARYL